jgi:hypothetical protein
MKSYHFSSFLLLLLPFIFSCSEEGRKPFEHIPDDFKVLKMVLDEHGKFQVQIKYTQIDRDEKNHPSFIDFSFNLNDEVYFYPASTVKLPVAILALEWLHEQQIEELTKESVMLTDSIRPSQVPTCQDSSAANALPSIGNYIKKILLVSDNDAYNRLYELLGQDYINEKMREKGMNKTVINHRLSMPMSEEENRHFNPVTFKNTDLKTLMRIPARETSRIFSNEDNPTVGKAYYSQGELVKKAMDFTFKNKLTLSDLHGTVQRIIFPEKFEEYQRFQITDSDRAFILKYMSMLPGESDYPKYELPYYYDSYSKFFKFGTDKDPIPPQFRIFNKTGNAYGHLLDGSYFVDFDTGVEFFVSAIIYTNANEILNDDTYEYEEIAFPFFEELGAYLYQIELKRKKAKFPDLNKFKFDYK